MEAAEVGSESVADPVESIVEETEDKHDTDSGIQNDVKDEDDSKIDTEKNDTIKKTKKKKKKDGSPIKSPKKARSRTSSPQKDPKSPLKSPKKRRRKVFPKAEKEESDAAIIKNPVFDANRSANRSEFLFLYKQTSLAAFGN